MKRTNKPLATVPNELEQPKKSAGFIANATDTFHELILLLLGAVTIGGVLYSLFEKGVGVFDGVWWAFVTAFTVGYGDTVPHTVAGRVLGIALMSFTVFVIIPLITARMASRFIVNNDAWTHEEQTELLNAVRSLQAEADQRNQAKAVDSGKVTARRAR